MNVLFGLRRSPATLALLLLGCLGVLYLGFSSLTQARMPSDGVLLNELSFSGVSVAVDLSSTPDGLRAGDQVEGIAGRTGWEWVNRALRAKPAADWRMGQTISYRVRRGMQVLEIPVELTPFPLGRMFVRLLGSYVLVAVSLGVCGYILLARPQDAAARLLFLAAMSLLFVFASPMYSTLLVTPSLFLVETGIEFLFECLLFSSILHLFLIFPATKPFLRGRETWLNGLHGLNPLLSLGIGLTFGGTPADKLVLALTTRYWIGLLMLVLGVVSVVHTYVTVRRPTVRSQIRWVAWGGVVGLLPFFLLTGLPEALSGRALVNIEITALSAVALPITVAIAVARYRLFDVDILIHRSLLYGAFTLLLSGLYLLLVAVLGPLLLGLTDTAVVFVATLLVSTLFWALRSRVNRLFDRLFYQTRLDPTRFLAEMSERLSSAIRLDDLAELLTQVLPERLGAHRGGLMVLSQDRSRLEVVDGDDFALPVEDAVEIWAEHGEEPVLRLMPPAWFPPQALDLMGQREVDLLFPLQVGDQMVGLWSLGARRSGLSYTSEEVQALGTVARQAAIALQNARLVRWLESHSYHLEEQVRRRTQDLERERNRLEAILQNMADGLLVTDFDGQVLLTNPALGEMVRYPPHLLLGRPLDEALNFPELTRLVERALNQVGRVRSANLVLDERVLKASAVALPDHSSTITVLRDITREVEVDRVKTEFISNVSHELRTPLTSMVGFAKLIRRTFERDVVPNITAEDRQHRQAAQRISHNLDIIVDEGERLTQLINDVLDIADMEAGRVEWHDRAFDLMPLVDEGLDEVREMVEGQGLSLTCQFQPESQEKWPPLVADPDRIRQLVLNLVSNAIKFTPQGEVRVSVRLLSPRQVVEGWRVPDQGNGGVLLTVADTGIGIPDEHMPYLFQRFQQLTDALPDIGKPKGTGLGLSICREIVGHYGGAIWAESEVGVGSTFYVALPLGPLADEGD